MGVKYLYMEIYYRNITYAIVTLSENILRIEDTTVAFDVIYYWTSIHQRHIFHVRVLWAFNPGYYLNIVTKTDTRTYICRACIDIYVMPYIFFIALRKSYFWQIPV